jgi:hypothetical protein
MKPCIVLYNPRSNASGKKILPMSLLAVGAVLENRYDYTIVDGNCGADPLDDPHACSPGNLLARP